jgi:S1-C subfamily serine protease
MTMEKRQLKSRSKYRKFGIHRIAGALVAATTALLPLTGLAQPPRNSAAEDSAAVAQLEHTIQDAIARAEPSVVAISRTSPPKPAAIERRLGDVFDQLRATATPEETAPVVGAGVLIDRSGLVLTQYLSVAEGDQHFITTIDRKTYPASIRAADARSGLAILAITPLASPLQRAGKPGTPESSEFPALAFGDAESLRKGQFVISIGNPFAIKSDGQPTASWGIITNLARKAPAGTNLNDAPGPANDYRTTLHHLGTLIQTDAKLGWSTGGGALVNLRGELIGLTTTAATIAGHEQPAGYAIPMTAAFRRIIDTLKEGREVEYGMLGVGFGPQQFDSPLGRGSRLTLVQVYPGSPAANAGFVAGDTVTRVADQPVSDVDEVQLAVSLLPPSTPIAITYIRNGQPATARLTVAKLAAAGRNIVTVRPESWHGLRVDYATALNAPELAQAIASGALDPQGCVLVTEVEEGSDAWKAGIRAGMFVRHVGQQRVTTPAEFQAATSKTGGAFDVKLTQPVVPAAESPMPDASKP